MQLQRLEELEKSHSLLQHKCRLVIAHCVCDNVFSKLEKRNVELERIAKLREGITPSGNYQGGTDATYPA